jgi:hypothetical protein
VLCGTHSASRLLPCVRAAGLHACCRRRARHPRTLRFTPRLMGASNALAAAALSASRSFRLGGAAALGAPLSATASSCCLGRRSSIAAGCWRVVGRGGVNRVLFPFPSFTQAMQTRMTIQGCASRAWRAV